MGVGITSAMGWEWDEMGTKCIGMGIKTWEWERHCIDLL